MATTAFQETSLFNWGKVSAPENAKPHKNNKFVTRAKAKAALQAAVDKASNKVSKASVAVYENDQKAYCPHRIAERDARILAEAETELKRAKEALRHY